MLTIRMILAFRILLCVMHYKIISAMCTFPENLRNSNWTDSDKGTLVFTDTQMTGWDLNLPSGIHQTTALRQWECYHNETGAFASLILKYNSTISYGSDPTTYTVFLCLNMTAITSYSYYYYIHAPEQANIYYERINILLESSVSSITDPQSEICNIVTVDSTENEYHVLIKEGHAADTIQTCPSAFFGVYSYSVTDIDASSSTCGSGNERWDVCTDRQRMTLNYTLCNTTIAYSANGRLFCVVSLTSGAYVLHTVYNEDTTVDNVNTYRFTCFVSSLGANGFVSTSQSPKSCTKTQTPDAQPTLTNGTVVGLNIALTPIELCPLTSDSEDSSTVPTGAIVGGVVGGVALIALIAILVCVCLHFNILSRLCKGKTRKGKETDNNENKDDKKAEDEMEKTPPRDSAEHPSAAVQMCSVWPRLFKRKSGDPLLIGEPREFPTEPPPRQDDRTESFSEVATDENIVISYDGTVKCCEDDTGKARTEDVFTNIAVAVDELLASNQDDKPDNATEQKCETVDEIQTIRISQSSNTTAISNHDLGRPNADDKDDIQVTRISQTTERVLSKGQHLNSTENICADYDAAMTYHPDKGYKPEKRDPFSMTNRPLSSRTFDFVRDDSGIETETISKQIATDVPLSKRCSSEGNLVERVKSDKKRKKTNSFRSVLNLSSIQWNFSYVSPYALTFQQKQQAAQRRIQNQKRKKRDENRKKAQEEARKQKNAEAFQIWSEKKREETSLNFRQQELHRRYKYNV